MTYNLFSVVSHWWTTRTEKAEGVKLDVGLCLICRATDCRS